MIWDIITGFLPDMWPYLLAIGAGIVAFLTGRSSGAAKAKAKHSDAALKATTKGAEAARKGRAEAAEQLKRGKTPEEIVRGNDDAWR
jgi:hypothetical protein